MKYAAELEFESKSVWYLFWNETGFHRTWDMEWSQQASSMSPFHSIGRETESWGMRREPCLKSGISVATTLFLSPCMSFQISLKVHWHLLWNEKREKMTLFFWKKTEISSLPLASYLQLFCWRDLTREFILFKAKGKPFHTFPAGQGHLVSNLGHVCNCLDDQPMLLTNPQSQGARECGVPCIYRWVVCKQGAGFLW